MIVQRSVQGINSMISFGLLNNMNHDASEEGARRCKDMYKVGDIVPVPITFDSVFLRSA